MACKDSATIPSNAYFCALTKYTAKNKIENEKNPSLYNLIIFDRLIFSSFCIKFFVLGMSYKNKTTSQIKSNPTQDNNRFFVTISKTTKTKIEDIDLKNKDLPTSSKLSFF